MKLVILTQDDPFYLADNISYLCENLGAEHEIVGCVVFNVSPFGKKESFVEKSLKTLKLFGLGFFVRYGFKFVMNKFNSSKDVHTILKRNNIPLIELEGSINAESSLEKIRSLSPDLLVSIAGNQIFKRPLIDLAPKGCINLHSALLPVNRGLMPSFWALKLGHEKTGVSVFLVDEGIDSGPIVVQKELTITEKNLEWLILKTKIMGMDSIIEAISLLKEENLELIPNPAEQSTYNTFPTKEDIKEFNKAGNKFY